MTNRRTIELWVGLFVAAGIAALGVLALKVGNLGATEVSNGYRVTARFDNIGGLKAKAPVTLAGVRIGRVTGISVDGEGYQAVVEIILDGQYRNIPVDSSAAVLTAGLLGEQYVGLSPGAAEQYLREGDQIARTSSALVLEELIQKFVVSSAERMADGK